MLNVQIYLREGKTLDELNQELGITATHHDVLPLVILNYSQIDSPKGHPIVRECRGLVLNKDNWEIAAKSFNRFYNLGEMQGEELSFNWDACTTQEKCDGSLVLIYHFDGEWRANTRGSFGTKPMLNDWQAEYFKMPKDFTWHQAFCRALGIKDVTDLQLDTSCTYVCEFCSQWNKVVRDYPEPKMFLLTRFVGEEEVGPDGNPAFSKVDIYPLSTPNDISQFCETQDATFEGCVVKDDGNRRWKIKNLRYVALHKLKGANGDALYNPSTLVPLILANEGDEVLATYPEITDCWHSYKAKVDGAYVELEALWHCVKDEENQKDFAILVEGETPFTDVLFQARRHKTPLKDQWLKAENNILKHLFK